MNDELKKVAFDVIYKYGSEDCGDWIDSLINNYPHEVVDAFGNNPPEVYAELADLWSSMDYEDTRTGICLTYRDWAVYFANDFGHIIYDELIKAKVEANRNCLVTDEQMIKSNNSATVNGDGSVAVNGNNNSNVVAGGDSTALLQERIKHLEQLLAEKERLISVLMEGRKYE